MKRFSRILIDVDASAEGHPGLDAALRVAAHCAATVKIVDVLEDVPPGAREYLSPRLETDLVAHRREQLAAIAQRSTHAGVTTDVLRGRPATALIREVLRSGQDLLVRSHGRTPDVRGKQFGPIDMELLRHCPCPVWLAGSQNQPGAAPRILAAVHANPDDAAEQMLNSSILELALLMAELMGGRLSIIQTWTAFGETLLASHMPPHELKEYVESTRAREHEAFLALTQSFHDRLAADATMEFVKGEAEDVIPKYVDAHEIDLVVMGTVARTGVVGLLIGNTAERVLQRVRVSVLATKPAGFKSPVTLDDA
jgi:nucleotide-binding universal stress UspA family protein